MTVTESEAMAVLRAVADRQQARYEEGWWVECTARAKKAHKFWRIEG